ncbi:MAG: hypothetical protein AAFP76_13175 [Bacteroidota bacterium]
MGRIHLFEFEDLRWFPDFLRNYGTDFLQFLSNRMKVYRPVVPLLEMALSKSNTAKIIDLGSGGGGGLLWVSNELKKSHPNLKILLTDLYPNIAAFGYTKKQSDHFEYIDTSVDARNVPANLSGLRTQFLSLHHFKPKDAVKILQNAVDAGQGIAIVEAQERSVKSFLAMFFSPISVLLSTPFIRPFKIGRIIFTYVIPLVPCFVWWDGMVSCLRTYNIDEMKELMCKVHNNASYHWDIGKLKSGPGVLLYLIGLKKDQ